MESTMIKVSKIPKTATEDLLLNFFENKRKTGGDDVVHMDYNQSKGTAIITYEASEGSTGFNPLCYIS